MSVKPVCWLYRWFSFPFRIASHPESPQPLFSATLTHVPIAGDIRNDIYVTLIHGEFDKGKKKTPKNVEVTMSVFDEEGNLLEVGGTPGNLTAIAVWYGCFAVWHTSSLTNCSLCWGAFGCSQGNSIKPGKFVIIKDHFY